MCKWLLFLEFIILIDALSGNIPSCLHSSKVVADNSSFVGCCPLKWDNFPFQTDFYYYYLLNMVLTFPYYFQGGFSMH
jgi:hypothetical protein